MPNNKGKNILSVDWTTSNGLDPFHISPSGSAPGFYAVAVETPLTFQQTKRAANRQEIKRQGIIKILEEENRNTSDNVRASINKAIIPQGANGTYVPLRDFENIKVLVQIPFAEVDVLPTASYVRPMSYDTISVNSFRLSRRTNKVRDLLHRFDTEANDFDGKLYNINFQNEAERIERFPSLLKKLARSNGFDYKESASRDIVIGISGSGPSSDKYLPVYVEYDSGIVKQDLIKGYKDFRESDFITSNTMFILKNLDDIEKTFAETAQTTSNDGVVPTGDTSNLGWEYFAKKYIRFPTAVIEHTQGRRRSPTRDQIVQEVRKEMDKNPVKTVDQLEAEERKVSVKRYQENVKAVQQEIDYVGDVTIGAIGKGIDAVQSVEDVYNIWLDKLGIRFVVEAALKCLKIDLPFEEIKAFLRLANNFFEDIVEILQIPTISLESLIPTVDIMFDILEQVIVSIAEAVFNAIWGLLKQILITLLENCGDLSKASLGGIPIGDAFRKGGLGGLLNSTKGVLGQVAGTAALQGLETGFLDTSLSSIRTQQFVSDLLTFVDQVKVQEFVDSGFRAIDETIQLMSVNLTPGEISRGLRGDPTPNVVKMTQNIAFSLTQREYPTPGADTVLELLDTPEKVKDFYFNLGKIIDQDDILKQIENFDNFIPGLQNGLCDLDDSPQRKALLEGKGLTEEEAQSQINAAKERSRKALNELEKFLEDPDAALQQAMPPMFCKTDENGQVVEGMFSLRHDSLMFLFQRTLNTMFDGTEMAFEQDISRFPEMLKLQTFSKTKKITRTVISNDNFGTANIDGETRKINPEFKLALQQGYVPDPPFNEYGAIKKKDGDFVAEIPATQDGRDLGLKETIREAYNIDKQIEKGGPGAPKPFIKNIAENTFAPGLSGTYKKFQTDVKLGPTNIENIKARGTLIADRSVLEVNAENQIKNLVQKYGDDSSLFLSLAARDTNFLSSIDVDKYVLVSQQLQDASNEQEKFAVLIRFNVQNSFYNSYKNVHTIDIDHGALNVINERGLTGTVSTSDSTKENHFVEFLSTIWTQAEKIYDKDMNELEPLKDVFFVNPGLSGPPSIAPRRPGQALAGTLFPFSDSFIKNQSDASRVKSLYEELWRDLVAEFLTEVGKDNELLEKSYDLLNLNPRSTLECKSPSIFGLEQIKKQVLDMYDRLYCVGLEKNLPNVTGLGSNKDNAIEQSIIYGMIKSIVRLYTIDTFLKSLITFNKLYYNEVDEVFLGYIENELVNDLKRLDIYYQFREETVKAYNNRFSADEGSFSAALKSFIREELGYVGNLLVKISGATRNRTRADNILSRIIKEYDVQSKNNLTPRLNDQRNKGFTDWRNGNFYFEKYVRVKPKQFLSPNPKLPEGVMSLDEFQDRYEQLLNDPSFLNNILYVVEQVGGASTVVPGSNPDCKPDIPEPLVLTEQKFSQLNPKEAFMSDIFEYVRFGYRLVCQTTQTRGRGTSLRGINDNKVFKDIKKIAFDDNLTGQEVAQKNKSYYVNEGPLNNQTQKIDTRVEAFTFPVVSVEEGMDISQREVFDPTSLPGAPLIPGIQIEYDQAISILRDKIKETNEWSFMFDYCFPQDRAVSLAALYNITYFKSLGGIDTIFENTKQQLKLGFLAAYNSGNYKFDDGSSNINFSQSAIQGQLPGFDLGKMGLMFIMSLLKSAGETFSPAIVIASKVKLAHQAAERFATGAANILGAGDNDANRQNRREEGERRRQAAGQTNDVCKITDKDFRDRMKDNELWPYVKYLFPMDLFIGAPGPPLTPLGYLYLDYDNIMNNMFKTQEQKELERCDTNFENACPPDDETNEGGS